MTKREKHNEIKQYIAEVLELKGDDLTNFNAEKIRYKFRGDSFYTKTATELKFSQINKLTVAFVILNEILKRHKLSQVGDVELLKNYFAKFAICSEFMHIYLGVKYHFDKKFGIT